jgi:hypothetical protein
MPRSEQQVATAEKLCHRQESRVNQTSKDVQHNSMHLHLVHTKNDIDPLAFQDDKGG